MGIPAFYRWLVQRYPLAVADAVEEAPVVINGVKVPLDTSQPNPNGLEFDNLYLDMNGIIHPCFHPEGLPPPKTYDEVFKAVFMYIDRIFSIVRPRKLLYMAIDGVAPRAKMNQQRARRFKTAKDAADEAAGTESSEGLYSPYSPQVEKLSTNRLDSNVITPGTEFMALLSSALHYYVHLRMNNDLGWQGIKVILSDASVPGEGEHKIMSYIRLQRNLPGFDPNTRHCLYGLDADLIMLALATHEIHFSILREDICKAQTNSKSLKQVKREKVRHLQQEEVCGENIEDLIFKQKFQFLNIWVLRDYLSHDLRIQDPTVKADLEHLIDDFVFMCLFVGNDFLPHVPSLEISEGAIDLLMFVYKKEFVQMGGYLTNSFEVNLECVEHFVRAVGSYEIAIFRKRNQAQKEREIRFRGSVVNSNVKKIQNPANHKPDVASSAIDKVKLGEEGWKERYYTEKFETKTEDDRERVAKHAVLKYIEGICWVMHYYYQGVCSWQWFYPYHYAPFASDFYGLDQLEIKFTLGKPFKPFDQLMGVLPAASAQALPLFYRKLMTDPSSPILDFYTIDFQLDMNGRRYAWQAVCKLPFINECRLISEIAKVEHTLTDEERKRNSAGLDMLFVHKSHPLATKIFSFSDRWKGHPKLHDVKVKWKVKPRYSGGMNGYVYISDKPVCPGEIYIPVDGMEIITKNEVISVFYRYPSFHPHIPKPPKGVILPEKSISKQDILPPPVLWHEKSAILGRVFSERPIPKSVMGSSLAKLAHRLVSKYYLTKQQEKMDNEGQNYTSGEPKKRKHNDHDSLHNEIEWKGIGEKHRCKRRKKHGAAKQQENMHNEGGNCTGGEPRERKENDLNSLDNETELKSVGEKCRRKQRKKHGASKQQENMNGFGNYASAEPTEKKHNEDHGSINNEIEQGVGEKCKRKRRKRRGASKQQEDVDDMVANYTKGEPGKNETEDHDSLDNGTGQKSIGEKCLRKRTKKMLSQTEGEESANFAPFPCCSFTPQLVL